MKKYQFLAIFFVVAIISFCNATGWKTEQVLNQVLDDTYKFLNVGISTNSQVVDVTITEKLATSTSDYALSITTDTYTTVTAGSTNINLNIQNESSNSDSLYFRRSSTSSITTSGTEIQAGQSYAIGAEYQGAIYLQGEAGGATLDIRIDHITE